MKFTAVLFVVFAVLLAMTSAVPSGGSGAAVRGNVAAGMPAMASLVRHDGEDHSMDPPPRKKKRCCRRGPRGKKKRVCGKRCKK